MANLVSRFQTAGSDLLKLLYPECCLACSEVLSKGEEQICLACQRKLPVTGFHENFQSHRLYEQMSLFFPFTHIQAYLFFNKKSGVQRLLHGLKYYGKGEIGELLGRWHGAELAEKKLNRHYDLIVPVPLHPRKKSARGYNQAELYGKGLSEAIGVPQVPEAMLRTSFTKTQTRKSREERLENVRKVFRVSQKEAVIGKRILLVDDVITTGATLESCAVRLSEAGAKSVGAASIAFSDYLF